MLLKNKYLLIAFFLFIIIFFSFGNENYNNFSNEYSKKNYKKALFFIKKAYEEEPENNGYIYWYGILLYMNNDFLKTIDILKKLPIEYYTYPSQWYHVESYIKLGKNQNAINLLNSILKHLGASHEWNIHFYPKLINLLIEEDRAENLHNLEIKLKDYYKDKNEDYSWIKYLYCKHYIDYSLELVEKGKYKEADVFFHRAITYYNEGLGGNEKYISFFSYGEYYYKLSNYNKAYEIFNLIPHDNNTLMVAWYKAECLKQLKKYSLGIKVLEDVLNKKDEYWNQWIYSQLIDIAVKNKDTKILFKIENDFLELFKDNNENIIYWSKYLMCKYYYDLAVNMMAGNFDEKIFEVFSRVKKVYDSNLGENKKYINIENLNIYKEACKYWMNNNLRNDIQKHKFLILFFKEVDGTWEDKNGVKNPVKNVFDVSLLDSIKKENEIVVKLLYYFSKGEILPVFDYKILQSRITELKFDVWTSSVNGSNGKPLQSINVISPVLDTATPHHGQIIFENINSYDSFVYVFPSMGIPVGGTGGLSGQNIIPFLKYTKLRAGITSGDEVYSHGLILHELFHAVEGAYSDDYKFVSHIFTDEYKEIWPDWYNGEGEYYYQRYIYEKVILKSGINKLIFKNDIDNLSVKEFEKYIKYLKDYSLSDLKSASDYQSKAVSYYSDGDSKSALKYFEKSYNAFPYNEYVNEMLGWIYYKESNFKKSLFYYLKCNKIKQKRKYLTMVAFLYEQLKEIDKTFEYYKTAFEVYNEAEDLYNIARVAIQLKKYDKSVEYNLLFLKNYKNEKYKKYVLLNLCHIFGYYKINYNKLKDIIPVYYDLITDKQVKSQIAYYIAVAFGETGEKGAALKWLDNAELNKYSPQKNIDYYRKKYSK